jgi:spore maturation protein CgeB
MVELGHDVVLFDFDLEPFYSHADPDHPATGPFVEAQRSVLESELLSQMARAHAERPIDLFFSYFYSSFARPEVIREIAAMGVVTVNWYCNASYQFHLVREIAPAYSYCLVPERFRLDDYRAAGARPIYCQEAANPGFYRPQDVPQEYDVAFVGSAYGDRPAYVRALLDAGLDAHAWGPGWRELARPLSTTARVRRAVSQTKRRLLNRPVRPPRLPDAACGEVLSDEDMVSMFSRSKISLGFSSVGDTGSTRQPIRQVRLRDFEAPMSGAFYMLEYLEEIEEFFVPGKEIVCFDGPVDLVEKCRYYLSHDEEREEIGRAGRERALRDHTWQRRLAAAFVEMGFG